MSPADTNEDCDEMHSSEASRRAVLKKRKRFSGGSVPAEDEHRNGTEADERDNRTEPG